MLPNFLIAGGVASGTSFLSETLSHHPDIYLPRIQRPEPNFFHYSWKFSQGIEWYQKNWFHEVQTQISVGERSSLLLSSNVAAKRIKETLSNIKIIFCLRNPIERAWANYRFTVLEGLESLSFDDAIASESERMSKASGRWQEVQPHAYLFRSHYSQNLSEYNKLFSNDNILILKSEDLGINPEYNLKRTCQFLNVDPTIKLPLPLNYSSPSVKNRILQTELRHYFGERFSQFVEFIRMKKDVTTLELNKEDHNNVIKLRKNLENSKNPMSNTTRLYLRSLFQKELSELSDVLDFCIDDWN